MPKNDDFYIEVPPTREKDEPKFEYIEQPPTDALGVLVPPAGKTVGDKRGAAADSKEK